MGSHFRVKSRMSSSFLNWDISFCLSLFDGRNLTAGWNECTNLQKVSFPHNTRFVDIQALEQSPKCSLKLIKLIFAEDSTEVKKSMDAFANAWIITLETVEIHCPVPPPNTFNRLVERNKSLCDVRIWLPDLEFEDDTRLERVSEIVGCFMQCRALQVLVIEDHGEEHIWEKPIDTFEYIMRLKYRHRRVAVWVLRFSYSKEGKIDFLEPFCY